MHWGYFCLVGDLALYDLLKRTLLPVYRVWAVTLPCINGNRENVSFYSVCRERGRFSVCFQFKSTNATTLKCLDLLFVLQPTQHGLIVCKCSQKVEITHSNWSQVTGVCRGHWFCETVCSVLVLCHPGGCLFGFVCQSRL